jgi:hypothetical protein
MAQLSGELSRRRLESDSGFLRREARRLRGEGYGGAAQNLALQSVQAKAAEKARDGSIRSAEGQQAMQEQAYQQGGVVSGLRRRLLTDAVNGQQQPAEQAGTAVSNLRQSANSNPAGSPSTPRLDAGPQTPGLDSNPVRPTGSVSSLRQQVVAADGGTQAAAQGSQLLRDRQQLAADIRQTADANGDTGALLDRARQLGVAESSFRRVEGQSRAAAQAGEPGTVASIQQGPPKSAYVPPGLQVEESPLVKQATAIRDANRILESRNAEQAARETASLPTIGSVPETPQTPISALRQSVVTPTFEELTTTPEATAPATPVSALRQQVMQDQAQSDPNWSDTGRVALSRAPDNTLRGRNSFTPTAQEQQDEKDRVYNSIPDLPVAAADSIANRVQKSVRSFFAPRQPSTREQDAIERAKATYDALPLEEKQRRARAEAARRSAQGY